MQELSGVTEAGRELAMSRFRLIEPYLEERRSLQLVAADANLSFRTVQRWVSQYRKLGPAAFARKAREDRGARRVVSANIKAAIEGWRSLQVRSFHFVALRQPTFVSRITVR
jgi:putative transposase